MAVGSLFRLALVALLPLVFFASSASAAFVEFRNCLDSSIINSDPRLLQFDPLNVTAFFDTASESHNLNVTVYGNVTGKATNEPYPLPDDPSWSNPNNTFGKIPDLSAANNKYTTLFSRYTFLTYTPWNADPSRFCDSVIQGDCPLAPAFFVNSSELAGLPAFSVARDLFSSYSFASLQATLRIQSGDASGQYYSCITATITPDLGGSVKDLLRYLPLAVLVAVAFATVAAAVWSPWGSTDLFHWSSNFGRDEDLLRLVTPGFGDCLQYIQFVILTGSLSLNYPGFYQPAVSRVSWSALMFNESFVSGGNGTQSLVDGIYQYRNDTRYGLDRMSQLVGMTEDRDIWAAMIIWLVILVAAVSVLTQLGFAARWLYRVVAKEPAEDLRSKNLPFTVGNIVRIVLNFFLLPLTSLSFYQLVIASRGPAYSVALSAVLLVAVVAFSVRLVFLFVRTRPRSFLFDDLLTLLAYGPLYNTYCDDAATFALIPLLVNFIRGVAIGAVQQSGVAQIVLLAVCEIVLILTINAFRPFPSATSMNVYHTCFSVIRLFTILLSIAFVPSLDVDDASRGWIGYAMLLIHACALVFGFFLNAIQTLIEVIAHHAGAGGRENDGSVTRGGLVKVFGMRQLSRRMPRRAQAETRASLASNAAIIDSDHKQQQLAKEQSRSASAASGDLLGSSAKSPNRLSHGLASPMGEASPDTASTFSKRLTNRFSGTGSLGAITGLQRVETRDPFYRPPRRNTMDPLSSPGGLPDLGGPNGLTRDRGDDGGEGTSTPVRADQDDFEDVVVNGPKPDYAVREVDFYYGVRGAALSSGTRKLKTGPADPNATSVSSAAKGWFKGLMGGKTKEKNKGFEVVRSARAPPPGLFPPTSKPESRRQDSYHDDEQPMEDVSAYRVRSSTLERARSPIASPVPQPYRHSAATSKHQSVYDDESVIDSDDESQINISPRAPSLPLIDTVGAIELPSRIGSEASHKSKARQRPQETDVPAVPEIPRKSSRRQSGADRDLSSSLQAHRLSGVSMGSNPGYPIPYKHSGTPQPGRIPFSTTQPNHLSSRHSIGGDSAASSIMRDHDENLPTRPSYTAGLRQASSALGHHGADTHDDRPGHMGFVTQHRASDHIHQSPDSPEFAGSSAEIYGRPANW